MTYTHTTVPELRCRSLGGAHEGSITGSPVSFQFWEILIKKIRKNFQLCELCCGLPSSNKNRKSLKRNQIKTFHKAAFNVSYKRCNKIINPETSLASPVGHLCRLLRVFWLSHQNSIQCLLKVPS